MLLVLGAGQLATRALEVGATLTIGRDPSCDLAIDHPKVSRRHAVVRGTTPATVEDAGGTNRVRVAGRALGKGEAVELPTGGSFQLGPITVVLLGTSSPGVAGDGRASLEVRDVRASVLPELITRIAASDVNVLIRGETGTGKDVLARAIHAASKRPGPLVSLNCAALNETLLESELFGYERGAFTGAVQMKPGLFETAAGGTVFLDEVADMPASVQGKLLRAIEAKQAMRLGGTKPIDLDVRFLAATHRDLRTAVATKVFRQDLYYRLNGITVVVPPLRDRKDMIPALVAEFLAAIATKTGRASPRLDAGALAVLVGHDWPGNVRELRAVTERAVLMSSGDTIAPQHILIEDQEPPETEAASDQDPEERARIIAALEECAGNQTRAAKALGISRATLTYKLSLHRIARPRK